MRVEDCGETEERKQGYRGAIDVLRIAFQNVAYAPDDRTLGVTWPIMIPKPYMDGLADRTPMALALLAHYAVLLFDLRMHWWAGDRGLRILEVVSTEMPPEWMDTLFWPNDIISNGRKITFTMHDQEMKSMRSF